RTDSFCDGGRMDGGRQRLAVTWPCSDLQAVEIVAAIAATARTVAPIAAVTAIKALAPIAAVAPIAAALVAITIALGATHHGRRAFFVRVDPDGKIAQNVLVAALQPFDRV